jgi:flagellar hook-associated protein 2
MATITSLGAGSGLDLNSLLDQLVEAARAPKESLLNLQEAQLQAKLSAYGSFKSGLSSFQDALSGLQAASDFRKTSASSSNSAIFTATSSGSAAPGSYSIEVSNLAQAHRVASAAFDSTTDTVGTGELTFRFGTYNSGGNTFTANAEKAIGSVTIDSSNSSLQGIRDAVNDADIGVTASIVNDGTGYRLLFKSDDSGAANSLEITVSDTTDGNNLDNAGLSQLAYDPTATLGAGKNLTQTAEAQDAEFSIDGLSMTRSSNTVSGAIEGVTLQLTGETSGAPATLTVAQDISGIKSSVSSFVDAYNTLAATLDALAGYDSTTEQGGILMGDGLVSGATRQIHAILTSAVSGLTGSYTSLYKLGISFQRDGTLELDASTLSAALADDPAAVGRLFAATGDASDALINYVDSSSDTVVGDYAVTITQLATQGSYTGATLGSFPITIDSSNDTFEVKVNGVQSDTITLTQGSYSSGTELAAQLQSQINADTNLQDSNVSVTVSFSSVGGDHFEITSSSYGSTSKVEFTAVEGSGLGLSVAAGTDGQDVAGTIGGVAASGVGQILYGSGDASGLELEVLGGSLGSRGTISFTRGVADQLNTLLESYVGDDSLIDIRSDGIYTSLDHVDTERDKLDAHIAALEIRYRNQFAALDVLLSQLQSTSNYLTQQLASLPGAYQSSSSS